LKKLRIKVLALCLLLILSFSVGIACGQLLSDSTSATPIDLSNSKSESTALPDIADVVALVKPSVVTIDTETTYRIFHRSFTQEGAGSGWIIDENGVIVTNNHVIDGAENIIVTLDDGRTFTVDPDTVATDEQRDLAILRIDAENLPALEVGDSSILRVGDWVITIGNPLGLGISAKEGIISRLAVSLSIDNQVVEDLIETSAAINPGNSGGPLVNMRGEVIGITSAKVSSVGVEGLGYAISIDEAMSTLEGLIASTQ
jgi:serine protease Do